MQPPKTITILSDQNKLEYVEDIKPVGTKQLFHVYKYVVSKTKKGTLLGLTESELNAMVKQNTP